jgi:anti-sigma factor RsiW
VFLWSRRPLWLQDKRRLTLLRKFLACRLTRRRIDRYLDSDPARDLTPATRRAVARHLDTCSSCVQLESQHRGLISALRLLGSGMGPDPAAVVRLNALLIDLENR